METFYTILAVVFLVFGVLQIILFFKIWGMANDINAIRNQKSTIIGDAKQAYLNGQLDIAKKLLYKNLKLIEEEIKKDPAPMELYNLNNSKQEVLNVYDLFDLEIPKDITPIKKSDNFELPKDY